MGFIRRLLRHRNFELFCFVVSFVVIVVTAAYVWSFVAVTVQFVNNTARQRMMTAAVGATHLADADMLSAIRGPEDTLTSDYHVIKTRLSDYARAAGLKHVFFLRDAGGGMTELIVSNRYVGGDSDPSDLERPPLPMTNASKKAFEGKATAAEVGEDYFFGYEGLLSAYAPIFDGTGAIVAIVGAAIDDGEMLAVHKGVARLMGFSVCVLILVICVGFLFTLMYQRKAVQAESASLAKTAFVSRMSHELRTPLNVVIGLSELTLGEPEAFANEETGLSNFKSTGVLRGFVEAIARVVIFIYQSTINQIYQNATLKGAAGIFLSFWGLLLGVVRKQESKTAGVFTGTAYGDGSISTGTWAVVPGTEIRFKVAEKVSFEEGSTFAIPVEVEYPGISYNIGSGTPVRLTRVVSGLDTVSVGGDWITSPGQNEEDDTSYRARIESRWKSQTLGDTKEVYKFYAEAVGGVRAAHIVRSPRGPGSTDVVIAAVNGMPNAELLDAVKAALYDHELMAFDVRVTAPDVREIGIDIEYTGKASEGDVMLVAERYVNGLGIGGRLALKDLYDLYRPLNLSTIEILSPDRDVQPGGRGIIVASIRAVKAA